MIDDTHVIVSYYYNFEQKQGVRKILGTILEIK